MLVIIKNLQTNFKIKNLNEFDVFSQFNNFITTVFYDFAMPHVNLKNKLLKIENLTNCTYQNGVDYLNSRFFDYLANIFDFFKDVVKESKQLPPKPNSRYIKLKEQQNKVFTDGKHILKLLIAKDENCEQYIEYCLPICWYDEANILQYDDYVLYEEYTVDRFNYPNRCSEYRIIKSNELKEGQSQQSTSKLILEKIKDHLYGSEEPFAMLSIDFLNPNKLLKNGLNVVSVNLKIDDFKFQVDFHIELIAT